MTFRYTDPDGDVLHIETTRRHGQPAIALRAIRMDVDGVAAAVHIPVDRVEEVVAGIRDTARQTAREGAQP